MNSLKIICLSFLLVISTLNGWSQVPSTTTSANSDDRIVKQLSTIDSISIATTIDSLNKADYSDAERGSGYSEGKVIYSPDGLFKVFIVSGDDNEGAYGYSIYSSFIQYCSGRKIEISETGITHGDFDFVDSIVKISPETYVTISKVDTRSSGSTATNYIEINQFRTINDSIYFVPIVFDNNLASNNIPSSVYDIELSNLAGENQTILRYSPVYKKIYFKFIYDATQPQEDSPTDGSDIHKLYTVKGEFAVIKGGLHLVKESKTFLKAVDTGN